MSIKPWAGVLVAGIGGAMLFIPHSETYQSTTFYEYLEVKIDCGNPMDSTVHFSDGIGDLISKNDPIFEGKSANRVCKDVDSKNRTTALVVLGIGVAGIIFTHKIAGPIFKMKRLMRQVGEGKLVVKEKLRKGDELHHFFETFEKMVENLRTNQRGEIRRLEEVYAAFGSDDEEVRAGAKKDLEILLGDMRDHIDEPVAKAPAKSKSAKPKRA